MLTIKLMMRTIITKYKDIARYRAKFIFLISYTKQIGSDEK